MNPTRTATWTGPDLEYPETDGLPMAENTTQFRWIVTIKEGVEELFRDRGDVFVAGDLFWYPVLGAPKVVQAPDTLVVFGRPPGDRRSYKQWEEDGIAPQVVFEVLSPGNTAGEMRGKWEFYNRHGVEEYYIYDPDNNVLEGWLRGQPDLEPIAEMSGWTSPRLGLRFLWDHEGLNLVRPDGRSLETYREVCIRADEERQRADEERRRADEAERQIADALRRSEEDQREVARLRDQLRALGIDPSGP
ncbi:MAG: Uma2 family endonuclease [Isosphaeraceae bacterium]